MEILRAEAVEANPEVGWGGGEEVMRREAAG